LKDPGPVVGFAARAQQPAALNDVIEATTCATSGRLNNRALQLNRWISVRHDNGAHWARSSAS
jgi:hypothetical protein